MPEIEVISQYCRNTELSGGGLSSPFPRQVLRGCAADGLGGREELIRPENDIDSVYFRRSIK